MHTSYQMHTGPAFAGNNLYEYLLVVHPAKEVYEQLVAEKQNFYNAYQERIAIKTLPHITIANFMAKEAMEETLIRYMHRIVGSHKSFEVMLNNFSGFPSSKTLYVRVQEHEPFKQMAASLKMLEQYINSNGCPKPFFISHPHLTIARRIQERVYDKAMLDYSQKVFHASFTVGELVLLRRKSQYDKCETVNVFRLAEA
ncbi:2'-5' RNA ligase family protein [Foetidibacter luteolus]|uniref:2'-5' RNA ligase family protein n=1 Tax=Foetidibacter luteolus TaxID=2608880 RepID=UPI001A97E510|nr:2'-5' RNA ligase family protein [Foetidibacter luteolus]